MFMQLPRDKDAWPKYWREMYEERAGIVEFMANRPREEAERTAELAVRRMAADASWEAIT